MLSLFQISHPSLQHIHLVMFKITLPHHHIAIEAKVKHFYNFVFIKRNASFPQTPFHRTYRFFQLSNLQ